MKFRPCIDIHNGAVKQIVGGSLRDQGDKAQTNYISEKDAAWYAEQYKKDGLSGGHVILLNSRTSPYYEQTKRQALDALHAYRGGLQVGGGITAENAEVFLKAGASHVIVTSWVFREGKILWERLEQLTHAVGKQHVVLDVSCRKKEENYFVVTDRWQTFTETEINETLLDQLSGYCDEFLIHGVDVEGTAGGLDQQLIRILGTWKKRNEMPLTYAGGIASEKDLQMLKEIGDGKIDFTIGSALDLFGGKIRYQKLIERFGR